MVFVPLELILQWKNCDGYYATIVVLWFREVIRLRFQLFLLFSTVGVTLNYVYFHSSGIWIEGYRLRREEFQRDASIESRGLP